MIKLPIDMEVWNPGHDNYSAKNIFRIGNWLAKPLSDWGSNLAGTSIAARGHSETEASKLFQATKTPGALPTRMVIHRDTGTPFVVTRLVPNSKRLSDAKPDEIAQAVHTMGGPSAVADKLLSGYLAGTGDRHGGNYVVSPTGIHSVDHELRFSPSWNWHPTRSALYNRTLDLPLYWTPEHQARWARALAHPFAKKLRYYKDMVRQFNQLPKSRDIRDIV